jgi:hypothetical protein
MVSEVVNFLDFVSILLLMVYYQLWNSVFILDQSLTHSDTKLLLVRRDGHVENFFAFIGSWDVQFLHECVLLLVVKWDWFPISKAVGTHCMKVDPRGLFKILLRNGDFKVVLTFSFIDLKPGLASFESDATFDLGAKQ